jgi:hypothetical protein
MINGTGEGCQGLSRTHRTCAFRVMKFHIAGYISMRFCESYPMILLTHLSVNVQGYNIIIIIVITQFWVIPQNSFFFPKIKNKKIK